MFDILKDEGLKKFHKDAWLTIVRFIKYWEKKKPENLVYILSFNFPHYAGYRTIGFLKRLNQKYSTKDLYLTDEEIKMIENSK